MLTFDRAFTGAGVDVGVMVPIAADSVPAEWRRHAAALDARDGRNWTELGMPTHGCDFGCKLYVKRHGEHFRYAVYHSRTYGHGSSTVTLARRPLVAA